MNFLLLGFAFFSSLVSGVLGILGGSLLLFLLSTTYSFTETLFYHGVIQLISCFVRTLFHFRHLKRSIIFSYLSGLLIPSAFLFQTSQLLNNDESYILLGVLLILTLQIPFDRILDSISRPKIMFTTGVVSGALGPIIGVTGTLTAPAFLKMGLSKEAYIGNKAACQCFVHIAKILIFGSMLDLSNQNLSTSVLEALMPLTAAIVVANLIAQKILHKMNIHFYRKAITRVIYAMGVFFIYRGLF